MAEVGKEIRAARSAVGEGKRGIEGSIVEGEQSSSIYREGEPKTASER